MNIPTTDSVISNAFNFWRPQSNRRVGQHDTHIPVIIKDIIPDGKVEYIASAPPDYRLSFSGSALPFATPEQALDNTPNTGTITTSGAQLMIPLLYPNSFYVDSHLVHPTVFLRYKTMSGRLAQVAVKIGESVPFRTLYHPSSRDRSWYDGVSFYEKTQELPVTTQERVLLNSAYPSVNVTPVDFWGKRPPT